MSIAPAIEVTRAAKPAPPPPSHARLPIVELGSDEHPLDVHYSAQDAAAAAWVNPAHEFLDIRGGTLMLVEEQDGSVRLVAVKEGDDAELRRRILETLRAAVKRANGGCIPKDVAALLDWLAAAPNALYLVNALGLAPTQDNLPHGKYCKACTWLQVAIGTKGCCPK